jgi:hypothetical protein
MTSAFWYEAPKTYRRVRVVPPGNIIENWAVIADYAQRLGLGTDAVYLARVDALLAELAQDAGVRLPGERREALAQQAASDGVDIPQALADQLAALAGQA